MKRWVKKKIGAYIAKQLIRKIDMRIRCMEFAEFDSKKIGEAAKALRFLGYDQYETECILIVRCNRNTNSLDKFIQQIPEIMLDDLKYGNW